MVRTSRHSSLFMIVNIPVCVCVCACDKYVPAIHRETAVKCMKVIPSHTIKLSIDGGNGRISHSTTHTHARGVVPHHPGSRPHSLSERVCIERWTHLTISAALMRLIHTHHYISAWSKLHCWWIRSPLPRLHVMVCPRWPSALLDIDGWIAIKLNPRSPNWFLVDFILGKLDFSLVASWGVSKIWFESEMEMLREGNREVSLSHGAMKSDIYPS